MDHDVRPRRVPPRLSAGAERSNFMFWVHGLVVHVPWAPTDCVHIMCQCAVMSDVMADATPAL